MFLPRHIYDYFIGDGIDIISDSLGNTMSWKPYRGKCTPEGNRHFCFYPDESSSLIKRRRGSRSPLSFRDMCFQVSNKAGYSVPSLTPMQLFPQRFRALPDVVSTPSLIGPLLSRTDTFVLIQNGIGIHIDLQKARPDAIIVSACAWVDSTTQGRAVVQTGPVSIAFALPTYRETMFIRVIQNDLPTGFHDNGKISLEQAQKACILLRDLFRAGGAGCEVVTDINTARWKKILW